MAAFLRDLGVEDAEGADARGARRASGGVRRDDLFLGESDPRPIELAKVGDHGVVMIAVEAAKLGPGLEQCLAEHFGVSMRKRAGQLGRCNRAIEERRDEARAARLAERAGPRMERGPVAQPLEISGPAFEPGGEAIESGSRQRLRPERAPQMKVEMPEKIAERCIEIG